MWYQKLTIILSIFPATLYAQKTQPDIIPVSDTITIGTTMLKGAGDFTYETAVDTVYTLVINEFMAVNSGSLFDNEGDDDDWFEIYNYGDDPVRINNLFFTDDPAVPFKWKLDTLEDLLLNQEEHFIIWADEEPEEGFNHASFKLSGEGEYLAIFTEDGTPVDQCYFGPQTTNVSYGRYPDAGLTWSFFTDPTPGASNALPGVGTVLPVPSSNLSGGLYSEPVMLALFSPVAGASIFYTTDCSEPDNSDLLYMKPVEISATTIIQAKLIKADAVDGSVLTISIIMDETDYENPVVSLVAEPEALYGTSGLISANNSSIEVTAHMEYIEEGEALFRSGTGIQLHAPKATMPN
ncbi:MAG: chitobiase/beta-hexosaminidase C-terminal domain-containing protein, partial [Bacteroidales bacterium]|nr:chitobiase/beta-hexosaminidase C-terminal domain-containing protein [Bacteroidales bacterium]